MESSRIVFVELHSEEVQEVLLRSPKWIIRWGITIASVLVILIFLFAWFVRYPDFVRASFRLTSENTPKAVLARTDGRIIRLFANEGELVNKGNVLAYLESTAYHDEVLKLSDELNRAQNVIGNGNLENIKQLHLSNYYHLGELQNAYQVFENSRVQIRAYMSNEFYSKKRALLLLEIVDLKNLEKSLLEQKSIQAQDTLLAQEDYEIQKQLYHDKAIARLEFKREESKNITRRLPFQQTSAAIINNLTAQRSKQKEILELDKDVDEERDKFLQALNTLRSEIDTWKMKYILKAPVSGQVSFPIALQENQLIENGKEVMYVSPPSYRYSGELRIPQQNFGKVQVGQNVMIKFAGFPYQEYGSVKGSIIEIASVPLKDSVFLAKVILVDGRRSTYGRSLNVKNGMSASADIITDDSRLLEKLFYQLRGIIRDR